MSDTSDVYIKMCNHPLIQKQRQDKPGDYLFFKNIEDTAIVCNVHHCDMNPGYYNSEDSIWLPQDDILEMFKNDSGIWVHLSNWFFRYSFVELVF